MKTLACQHLVSTQIVNFAKTELAGVRREVLRNRDARRRCHDDSGPRLHLADLVYAVKLNESGAIGAIPELSLIDYSRF